MGLGVTGGGGAAVIGFLVPGARLSPRFATVPTGGGAIGAVGVYADLRFGPIEV